MPGIKYSTDFSAQKQEITAIRKDIAAARAIIKDGLTRYKKKMLHARNKKQTEDMSMFAELDDYNSKTDIQDVFGWAMITYKEMERLNGLWDVREQVIANQGKYADRVTEMLERAMDDCGDMFSDILEDYDETVRNDKELKIQIERENNNTYSRYKAGL